MENTHDTGNDFELPAPGVTNWLKRLADESWQAELVISGAAIFGSFSLPGLVNEIGNWCLITFAEDKFFLLGMIMMYLYIMAGGLIAAFLIHFFIRVLWIGMLGLNSVYPQGILPIKSYSDDFNEKLQKELPDLEAYNHKIDQMGSLVFSIASAMCMVAISSILVLVVMMLLASLIHLVLPAISFNLIIGVLVFLLMIPTVLNGLLHLKKFKEKAWVKKFHFPIFLYSTKAIYTIFYKPFSYIIYTMMSSGPKQGNVGTMLLVGVLLGIFSATATIQSNVRYFMNADAFRQHGNPEYGLKATFYEDQRSHDDLVLYASLESDMLSGKFVKVFVPISGREDEARERLCGEYEEKEGDSKSEIRLAKQEFENQCLEKYIKIYLNDQPETGYSMMKYDHPETGQFGVNIYLSCEKCEIGKNEVKISRPYPLGADKPYEVFLPFMYEGEKK